MQPNGGGGEGGGRAGVEGMDAAVAVMVVAKKAVDRVVAEREVTVGAVAKEEGRWWRW